ncbi:MAG: hypothetical protein J6K21_03080 [Bacilli bacterium]|nr:hypothetical protein [Bacilli bacterium]
MEKKFRIISILFIVGCIIFYGGRFGYFYMKYNKKSSNNNSKEVLAITIQKKGIVSSGDGLYNSNGELVFKGKNVNNYLIYSNILWRIVRVNNDNSIVLVTDSKLTDLAYSNDTDFINSYIVDWLNKKSENTGIVESKLNNKEEYLTTNTICLDTVDNLNNITCHKKDNSKYVSILGIGDYLNSKLEDSYINNTDSIWLYNTKKDGKVWYITNGNLSSDSKQSLHGIKSVITLKNTIGSVGGSGTKEDPYLIEKDVNTLSFNSYVKLGNDLYTVYDIDNDKIKLVSTKLIDDTTSRSTNYYNKEFNPTNRNSIAYYLNNTYYKKLTYKDILIDCDYYTGDYSSVTKYDYKNIYNKKVTTKIGLLSLSDINLNNELNYYFYLNRVDNKIYSVNNTVNVNYSINKIRPTVCISKDTKLKGNGTKLNPFELEV